MDIEGIHYNELNDMYVNHNNELIRSIKYHNDKIIFVMNGYNCIIPRNYDMSMLGISNIQCRITIESFFPLTNIYIVFVSDVYLRIKDGKIKLYDEKYRR